MKKIISSFYLISLISCGAADGTSEDTDGLAPENHRIFVSSVAYPGNIGGILDANKKCAELAQAAGLVRTYEAILSTSASPASKLNFSGSTYIFTSSTEKLLVAASVADIWGTGSKVFLNKVNIDEKYNVVDGVKVWTGTTSDGGVANDNCNDWTLTSGTSWFGLTDKLDTEWIESNTDSCSNSHPIYCISQQSN